MHCYYISLASFFKHTSLILMCLYGYTSQLSAQTIRGTVQNKIDFTPLRDVTIVLESNSLQKSKKSQTVTDSLGVFVFKSISPGYYTLKASRTGMQLLTLREVQIAAGKERIVTLLMEEGDGVTIEAVEIAESRQIQPRIATGEIPLSRERVLHYPATFFDPARLAATFPGVSSTNDANNSISIRGNNPSTLRWRLAGADIVSPNHLPNANTLSDRPALASGGVMMLSAQMLGNSSLITGVPPIGFNDAVGGTMDLHLRRGNNQQRESTIQAGLIGVDVSTEGPFNKNKKNGASYLFNYRYSTVGLLGLAGVRFGGEKITFSDFAGHIFVPSRHLGDFSIFHIQGQSKNDFARPDTAQTYKDLFNINFRSRTVLTGVKNTIDLGNKLILNSSVVFSRQRNDREQAGSGFYEKDRQTESRVTATFATAWQQRKQIRLNIGATLNTQIYQSDLEKTIDGVNTLFPEDQANINIQAFLQGIYTFAEGAGIIEAGVHPIAAVSFSQSSTSLDPRLSASYRLSPKHHITFAAGSYSQSQPIWLQRAFRGKALVRSSSICLRHTWKPQESWVIKTEIFRQGLANLIITSGAKDAFSLVNETEVEPFFDLVADGLGRNYGAELSAEHAFQKGWFLNANLTFLRSEYQASDLVWRRTKWDVGYISNVTAGREVIRKTRKKSGKVRSFGYSGRAIAQGGQRLLPIDPVASANAQSTVFVLSAPYSDRSAPYFRLDARIYWKVSIADKRNTTFALECQNVTAQKNFGYQYYDPLLNQVVDKSQLGPIPNLSWRLEF